ncbi:TPR and ankyrin repeat-containing protein 1-like isoform X3 [Acanthaster planci]|uniref:TPR and ankyrin repeat-containing protein 1-like isoform X3 n=1 Tax=Acanthaster planci TaxID=133434 RepID=A0A8B7Y085_ACAPL|nr:TPR and ankyrin repeat-containing protein 1-like isoform X3 [Acanthaster planci]
MRKQVADQKQQGEEVAKSKQQRVREEGRRMQQPLDGEWKEEDRSKKCGRSAIDTGVFDDLAWEVECTEQVWKFLLANKQVPHNLKEIAIRKIQTLASGDWRSNLCKPLEGIPKQCDIKLYEAKLTKASRILWELAVVFSRRITNSSQYEKLLVSDAELNGAYYSEVIRVWEIVLDHSKVTHAMDNIVQAVKRGRECKIHKTLIGVGKRKTAGGVRDTNLRLPTCFREVPSSQDRDGDKTSLQWYPPALPNKDEHQIMKFYSFTSMLVSAVLNDSHVEVEFPFQVTELEHAIINLQPRPTSSILLLGRSGTGKTTCCLYRMWTKFVKYWQKASEIKEPWIPRDCAFMHLDEAEGVKEAFASSELASPLGSSNSSYIDHLHQIFITKNQKLRDAVQRSFCNMARGCPFAAEPVAQLNRSIPPRLQDAHQAQFPLFLTSRQFLLLLDASLPNPYFPQGADGSPSEGSNDACTPAGRRHRNHRGQIVERSKFAPRSEVTYKVFANELWPRINKQKLKCHPTLVWMEITSFIKGSFEALQSDSGYLSLEEYLDLGKKMAPNFTTDREQIYNIFKLYMREIQQKNRFDEGDLVFHVYRRLCDVKTLDWAIHEFYVDETQDFTQAELALLIQCSQDPNSLFLTGDTAQCIMRGVAFRFKDLKSLFHYANKSAKALGKPTAATVPKKVYHLTINYRSHSGILNLAAAVLELMSHFFPLSFDRLVPDQGLFAGPLPVILGSSNVHDLPSLLRKREDDETSEIEFGADQVILVADDSAKQPEVLAKGVVMTISEAKGLEFNDVLLYNFFKDSLADREWQVVTGFQLGNLHDQHRKGLKETELDWLLPTKRPHGLDFSPDKHKVLNSELKYLYTAITRARNEVWIFDEDRTKRAPMFELLCSNGLGEVKRPEDLTKGCDRGFVKSSSPSEWIERANYYIENNCWKAAEKCRELAAHAEKKQQERDGAQNAVPAKTKQQEQITSTNKAASSKEESQREEWIRKGDKYCEEKQWKKAIRCYQRAGDVEKQQYASHMAKRTKEVGKQTHAVKEATMQAARWFLLQKCDCKRILSWNWIIGECENHNWKLETYQTIVKELNDLQDTVDELCEVAKFGKAERALQDKEWEILTKIDQTKVKFLDDCSKKQSRTWWWHLIRLLAYLRIFDKERLHKAERIIAVDGNFDQGQQNGTSKRGGKVYKLQQAVCEKVIESAEWFLRQKCHCRMTKPWCWIPGYCQNHNWNVETFQLFEGQLNDLQEEVDKLRGEAEFGKAERILKEKQAVLLMQIKQDKKLVTNLTKKGHQNLRFRQVLPSWQRSKLSHNNFHYQDLFVFVLLVIMILKFLDDNSEYNFVVIRLGGYLNLPHIPGALTELIFMFFPEFRSQSLSIQVSQSRHNSNPCTLEYKMMLYLVLLTALS